MVSSLHLFLEGQMELNLFDQCAVRVDMFVHRSFRRFLELIELFFEDTDFSITLRTVLRDKLLPRVCRRCASHDPRVRGTIMLDGIKKVIVRKIVSLIPLVDGDFVR
jgi:hypothetical protein